VLLDSHDDTLYKLEKSVSYHSYFMGNDLQQSTSVVVASQIDPWLLFSESLLLEAEIFDNPGICQQYKGDFKNVFLRKCIC